jgi:hypothetical protein
MVARGRGALLLLLLALGAAALLAHPAAARPMQARALFFFELIDA